MFRKISRLTREFGMSSFRYDARIDSRCHVKFYAWLFICIGGFCLIGQSSCLSAEPSNPENPASSQNPEDAIIALDEPYVANSHPGSRPGSTQTLDLYVPKGDGPFPLVIWIHGGGWHGGDKSSSGAAFARQFIPNGFALASLNYRYTYDAPFPAPIEDCNAALIWLRNHAAQYHLQPDEVGVMGHSAGAHLAALMATTGDSHQFSINKTPVTIQAAVCWAGPFDLGRERGHWPTNMFAWNPKDPFCRTFFPEGIYNEFFAEWASPASYIHAGMPPILIVHGAKDTVVPLGQASTFAENLKKAGVDVTYHIDPEHGHDVMNNLATKEAIRFFKRTLKPSTATDNAAPLYRQANLSVDERVRDLLGRMTLNEKVRQLDMYRGCGSLVDMKQTIDNHTHAKPDAVFDPQFAEKNLGDLGVGSIHDLYPSPKLYNTIQSWVIKSNRLGIPALFIEEGLHGYMAYDQTVFPQSVNLASTWNPELARLTGAAIAAEARAKGVDMILGPVLDVARDPRWGRVEEDFGEDPFLSGQMGLNYVEGMQGESLSTDHTVIAEPKHFAAHGSPESGLNTSPVHVGEREVRSIMLKSFEPAIRQGNAMAVMAAYNDIDGVPCTGNRWLLNTVLRDEWGFEGFVLSDLGAIARLYKDHHVAATPADAVRLALNSGVDMQFYDFPHDEFQNAILDGIKNGQVSTNTLNAAIARILRVKFLLGLFDHPFVDENLDKQVRRSQAHLDLSLEVARQSMCLLKNKDNLLPLKKDLKRIAVIGPNANITRLGDYTDVATENSEYGIFNQVKQIVSPKTKVSFASGENINAAVALAKKADVVILGLGENKSISGEGHDRLELGLPGNQEELLRAIVQTGKSVVLVLENGRALTIPWAADHVPAILEAWYPGEFGGRAVAETLFGDNNPAGRLPVTFPKSVGQLPVFYDYFPSKNSNYIDGNDSPQFVFGFGLSYTTFKYKNLKVVAPAAASGDDVLVSFDLTNTGRRDGDEVSQVYVRETTASVATPIKALKAFSRVHLKSGETKHIVLHVKQSDLAVWGAGQEWKVEPGEFTISVGGSSAGGLSEKFILQ